MPTTDTPQPQAVDYSGRPLTEGATVAFLTHDPIGLCEGRIRIIGPNDLCIDTGDHLVTFPAASYTGLRVPPLRPLGGKAAPRELPDGARQYPQVALQPTAPSREQRERPTHPDGTPYGYAEMVAEGWGFCDGCRTWSTATPERPHQCPETHMSGPLTLRPAEDGA